MYVKLEGTSLKTGTSLQTIYDAEACLRRNCSNAKHFPVFFKLKTALGSLQIFRRPSFTLDI